MKLDKFLQTHPVAIDDYYIFTMTSVMGYCTIGIIDCLLSSPDAEIDGYEVLASVKRALTEFTPDQASEMYHKYKSLFGDE